jgi:hypothetical protein
MARISPRFVTQVCRENEGHPRPRDAASAIPLEHLPVSDPEIESPVFGRGASNKQSDP